MVKTLTIKTQLNKQEKKSNLPKLIFKYIGIMVAIAIKFTVMDLFHSLFAGYFCSNQYFNYKLL